MHNTYICIDIVGRLTRRYAKQNRITVREVVQSSPKDAELQRMVEVPTLETDEDT
jgi:hypothetical protein